MKNEKMISIWSKSLLAAQEGKSPEESREILAKLITILKKQKKEHLLPEILEKAKNILQREKRVELFLGKEHNYESISEIKNKLSDFFGQDKKIEVNVDKELIGGFRAKSEKFLVKASIKDFLNELKSNY
jgi:F0F1-type ATP synthase delta subunit